MSGKREPDWDWSAKHTRLRYQLVLTSLLLFLLVFYRDSQFVLKFIPIEFSENNQPKKIFIVATISVYFGFSALAFVVRSMNERKLLNPRYDKLRSKLSGLVTQLQFLKFPRKNDIEKFDNVSFNLRIDEILSLIKKESAVEKNVYWEREILGYWCPLILSGLLFFGAIIFGNHAS